MKQEWSMARLRWVIYAAVLGAGFLAPWRAADAMGPRTLWVWLGVWQSTMGMTSTTGIVLVTWVAVALCAVGAALRVWAAAQARPRMQAAGSLLLMLAVCVLMPPVGAVVVAPVVVAYEAVGMASAGMAVRRAARPHWVAVLLSEVTALGVLVCFAALSWRYNARLLEQALLVACGLGLIGRAALPTAAAESSAE